MTDVGISRWSGDPRWRYMPRRFPDGTEVMRPRSEGDCVRACVAEGWGFDYWDLPDNDWDFSTPLAAKERKDEFWGTWRRWADSQGLYLWQNPDWAPISLPRWIAGVQLEGMPHAVLMAHDQLVDDPNAARPWERGRYEAYHHIDPSWVKDATAFLPADQTTIRSDKWWRIGQSNTQAGRSPQCL